MEADCQKLSSDLEDMQNVENVASESATERLSTASLRATEGLQPRPVPKEAWKGAEERMDKLCEPRQKRKRNQSLWLMRTKKFCLEASVVGLRYVANPSASPFRRSIWTLLLVAGAAFTTFQIQNRIQYFLSRPVNVNFRIQHAEEIRFPTVTICNENRISYTTAAHGGK